MNISLSEYHKIINDFFNENMPLAVVYQLIKSNLIVYILNENGIMYPALHSSIFDQDKTCVKHVGKGIKKNDSCGKVKFKTGCETCRNVVKTVYHSCNRILCPICYKNAVKTQANRISARIEGMGEVYKKNKVGLGQLKHIVFSPPQWIIREMYERNPAVLHNSMLSLIHEYTKDGFYGGVLIFHGERKKHLDGTACEIKNCEHEHIWVWAPHYHYVGYGYFEKSNRVHELTGWIYKQISNCGTREVYTSVYYLLTHSSVRVKNIMRMYEGMECGLEERTVGQGYSYVGIFSNCKGGYTVDGIEKELKKCDKCGSVLGEYYVDDNDDIDWGIRLKDVVIIIKIVTWYINNKAQLYVSKIIDDFD